MPTRAFWKPLTSPWAQYPALSGTLSPRRDCQSVDEGSGQRRQKEGRVVINSVLLARSYEQSETEDRDGHTATAGGARVHQQLICF